MIPRRIHHIWLGPRPVPEEWAQVWRDMHPSWEHRVWREGDIAELDIPRRDQYDAYLRDGIWHGAADLARIAILDAVGGVYVDIDSRPLRPLDDAPFMRSGFFAALEPPNPALPGRVANGTIGSEPGHPILRTYRGIVEALERFWEPWDTVGGSALTEAMRVHRWEPLPARTFYPKAWSGKPVRGSEQPYAEHFWATTNHGYPVRAVVLVPRRAGDPVRDANWDWCRRIWEQQGWPIFEGHHDGPGLFSASKARNAAAAAAGDWDVAIFADADTVPWDWRPVRDAVPLAARTGRFIRPFTTYHMLDEEASRSFMATGVIPRQGIRRLRESAYGGIHVVPRRLWDDSGGYDERFLGWGSEDAAFEFACRVLGGFQRLPGDVYHLWHPMQPRDPSTPQFQANVALGARYRAIKAKGAMRRLIAEHTGVEPEPEPLRVGLLVITNGRRGCLERTIASIEQHIRPGFTDRLICDDSGSDAYAGWLREAFPAYRIDAHRHLGHGPAVARAFQLASRMDADWVFVCEDDMEYQQPIDLAAMAAEMDDNPDLSQMILRRQAWFPAEVEAGGMIERFDPSLFSERSQNGTTWIEHRQFWSISSNLVRRSFLARHRWPAVPNSEHRFSRQLFRDARVTAGIWGARTDPPRVLHIGTERTGSGY